MKSKRKTRQQLRALEEYYSDEKYPSPSAMEDYASSLRLTYKQVQSWFIGKRRRDKKQKGAMIVLAGCTVNNEVGVASKKIRRDRKVNRTRISSSSKYKQAQLLKLLAINGGRNRPCSLHSNSKVRKRRKKPILLNKEVITSDYILRKVFRKDGPPLGVEFDLPPAAAFCHCTHIIKSACTSGENQRAPKGQKVLKLIPSHHQRYVEKKSPVKKYGKGKGLMTVWRVTNPTAGVCPTGIVSSAREIISLSHISSSKSHKSACQNKKPKKQILPKKKRKLATKSQSKRKCFLKRRGELQNSDDNKQRAQNEVCGLSSEGMLSQEFLDQCSMLVDDEELELKELQAGPKPIRCSAHFSSNGLHSCSLCKDLLAKFPPSSVKMKQPFSSPPWDSSPEIVKKLFKVFHFLYTHALVVDICPFTLNEFVEAFHYKDSLLLGKIHVSLLILLLSDVEMELGSPFLSHLSKSCRFLWLLHSVECQQFVLESWKRLLNSLTWTEILRQVLVAAGFAPVDDIFPKEVHSKEINHFVNHGLRRGTLKGELFSLLLEQGNNGMRISELAKSLQIVKLNLASTTEELETLICSSLSSDISLFEKISFSAYRLRNTSVTEDAGSFHPDIEDSGSVDDSGEGGTCSDGFKSDSGSPGLNEIEQSKKNRLVAYTEIDESHKGEIWLLGLMEGEYSDLSIEEKLNALLALVDLVSAGCTIRTEDPSNLVAESALHVHPYGSGAKIKRLSGVQHNSLRSPWGPTGQIPLSKEPFTSSEFCLGDSSSSVSMFSKLGRFSSKGKDPKQIDSRENLHPLQSVLLGSDRRYNRYWLFLGPCNADDSGHRRIYFESSEDGHWAVIDTEQAFGALLSVLDHRGRRETALLASLTKREVFLCQNMSNRIENSYGMRNLALSEQSELDMVRDDASSPISDVDNSLCRTVILKESSAPSGAKFEAAKKEEEQKRVWSHLQAYDAWIWNSFYSSLGAVKHSKKCYLDSLTRCQSCHDLYWREEKHCKICHTTFELDFDLEERYAVHVATCRESEDFNNWPMHRVLPSQLQSLKAACYAIESAMPEGALACAWTKSARKLWVKRLRRTSSLAELLQVLVDFVGAIDRDWLARCGVAVGSNSVPEEITARFLTIPQTSSALALWLAKLDEIISPYLKSVSAEKKLIRGTDRRR